LLFRRTYLCIINNDSGTRPADKKKKSRVQCKNRIIVIIIRELPLKSIGCNMGEGVGRRKTTSSGGKDTTATGERLKASGRPPPPCQRQMPRRPGDLGYMIYLLLSRTYYVVSAGAFASVLVMFTTALPHASVFLRLI